jgi:hypothetical protein
MLMPKFLKESLLILLATFSYTLYSQIDTTAEEDYSQYENVSSEEKFKIYCNPKIFDLSPNRFVSVGYDYIFNSKISTSPYGFYQDGDKNFTPRYQ